MYRLVIAGTLYLLDTATGEALLDLGLTSVGLDATLHLTPQDPDGTDCLALIDVDDAPLSAREQVTARFGVGRAA